MRITVRHNPDDPAEDLRLAALIRRDLWAHSPVEIDPDSPAHGTHRDDERNAYFEFATGRLTEVTRVLNEFGHAQRATAEVVADEAGNECVNCGHLSPQMVTVCPRCSFRDIDPCPYCHFEIPRLAYLSVSGETFECPECHHLVRFHFHDPLIGPSGHYNQPLVLVSPAEAPVGHDV